MMNQKVVEDALKKYIVKCLEDFGVFIGRSISTYCVQELFEVYNIYAEDKPLIAAVPTVRQQVETGNYQQDLYEFLNLDQKL